MYHFTEYSTIRHIYYQVYMDHTNAATFQGNFFSAFVISDKEIMFSVALVCLSVCLLGTLLKKLLTDCNEILWRRPGW